MRKKVGSFLLYMLIVFLPALLGFLAKANISDTFVAKVFSINIVTVNQVIDYNKTPQKSLNEITQVKDYFLLFSILLTAIPLQITLCILRFNELKATQERNGLFKYLRDLFQLDIESKTKKKYAKINVRIFRPKLCLIDRVPVEENEKKTRVAIMNIVLKIKNFDGFSDEDNTDGLSFHTGKYEQGLVGRCYNKKQSIYEEDLRVTQNSYKLTDYQRAHSKNTRFCLAYPIILEGGKIKAIVTFDSNSPIIIDKQVEAIWAENVNSFCLTLEKAVPYIFK